jgi:hypothetical protein
MYLTCTGSTRVRDFAVIDLDMPRAGVIEISSSCDMSVFALHVDTCRIEGVGDAPEGSSSLSIGELCPDIDKLDEINHRATFMGGLLGGMLYEGSSSSSVVRVNERASPANKRTLMDDAPRPSSAPQRGHGCGWCSTRKKATQILASTLGAISPHMQSSFVDRQCSPSTGMDRSEWEIILEERTHTGYIIKRELDSDSGE